MKILHIEDTQILNNVKRMVNQLSKVDYDEFVRTVANKDSIETIQLYDP